METAQTAQTIGLVPAPYPGMTAEERMEADDTAQPSMDERPDTDLSPDGRGVYVYDERRHEYIEQRDAARDVEESIRRPV